MIRNKIMEKTTPWNSKNVMPPLKNGRYYNLDNAKTLNCNDFKNGKIE